MKIIVIVVFSLLSLPVLSSSISLEGEDVKYFSSSGSKITRKQLIEFSNNESDVLLKLSEFESNKKLISCLRALRTKFVSLSQLKLCKILDLNTLDSILVQSELEKNDCPDLDKDHIGNTTPSQIKEIGSTSLTADELFSRYHCSCSQNSLSCLNNAYYCGQLFDSSKLNLSYKELENQGYYNEIVGKSYKDVNLRKRSCYLNQLASRLPNNCIQRILDYSLRMNDVLYRPAPNYQNRIDSNLRLDNISVCKIEPGQKQHILSLIHEGYFEKIKNKNIPFYEKERQISKAVNNIKTCHNSYTDFLQEQIENGPLVRNKSIIDDSGNSFLYPVSKVMLKPIDTDNICSIELYRKLAKSDPSFRKRWDQYINESKGYLEEKIERLRGSRKALSIIEKERFNEENISKYLSCRKYSEQFKKLWTVDTSAYSELSQLNEIKQKCGGYVEYYEKLGNDYKNLLTSQSEEYQEYLVSRDEYLLRVYQSSNILELNLMDEVNQNSLAFTELFPESLNLEAERDVYLKQFQMMFKDEAKVKDGLSKVEKLMFDKYLKNQKARDDKVNSILSNSRSSQKLIRITIGNTSIGDFLEGGLDLVSAPLEEIGNFVNNAISETTQFVGYHTDKVRRWIADRPLEDIGNNAGRLVEYIACRGAPPKKGDDDSHCLKICIITEYDERGKFKRIKLCDKNGVASDTPPPSKPKVTEEDLNFMRQMELQDSVENKAVFEHLGKWVREKKSFDALNEMILHRNSELLARYNNPNLTETEKETLNLEMVNHFSTLKAIKAGGKGAKQAVINTVNELLALAKNPKQLLVALDAIYEVGLEGALQTIEGVFRKHYDDYKSASTYEEKSEIIGYVSAQITMALIPAGGALKGGTSAALKVGKSSKFFKPADFILKTSKKMKLSSDGVKDLVQWLGSDSLKLINNDIGSVGNIIKKYNPAPKSLDAFPDLKLARRKTKSAGGGLRKRWKDNKGNIYEWDYMHGRVEKYNKQGKHLGEYDPKTGKKTKDADPSREVEK